MNANVGREQKQTKRMEITEMPSSELSQNTE
jgi:hypothetical protein